MRLLRTPRAAFALVIVAALGSFGPALTGTYVPNPTPEMLSYLEYDSSTLRLHATGAMPGSAGAFNFVVIHGTQVDFIQIPVTFDAFGAASLPIPFAMLETGFDMMVGMQLTAIGLGGTVEVSPVWALTTHNYVVGDPSNPPCPECPTTAGSWVEWVPWPGAPADGSLYPHCLVAYATDEVRNPGVPMLALESGPAGSFPIN